ncbi:MAG: MFS transporter, partial [Gemmiger sp.]|uniref:MFS transporter n=1 Tax=Gemmiger sp. TaxID=2049027 RepID=UPI002E77021B
MVSLLLPIIYLAFISLGLPDALLGAAWPSMYPQLGAGVAWAGGVSMIISAGTIVSSLASERLNTCLGTGRVTALSVATTAVALFGFSTCTQFWQLCLWAIPYGLGAGSVDAALNNYVALHYESRHMSWLHCMWGIGAAGGPVIMGWALAGSTWQNGYRIISILQIVLTAVLIFSLPLWQTPADAGAGEDFTPEHRTLPQLMKVPGVPEVMCCFALYNGLEAVAGMWAASYCTLVRGLDATTAASWASLFYLGITGGRFLSGFLTMRFTDHQMIRLGQTLIAVGIALLLLPGSAALPVGLVVIGLGCAPIYPCIIHETPANFGKNLSMAMTG